MAKPSKYSEIVRNVTQDVVAHPRDLTRHYVEKFGLSRVAINSYIRRLENEGWISRSGPSTHPYFAPGYRRRVSRLYEINGLEEHVAWEKDFKPFFSLPNNITSIVTHGFTEMVNNAIDHSAGQTVFAWADQSENDFTLIISDDGVGIFKKISDMLSLPDMRLALFELSKGKLTTDPSKHSGEGVFFTSRMFDAFEINANGLEFRHSDSLKHDFLSDDESVFRERSGTAVYMSIPLESQKTAASVYAEYTKAPDDFDFSKTVVPMKLARFGDEQLVSRSQAKRLIARFDKFKTVILDFADVEEVGQAFADELFRVYANEHADVELLPKNMSQQVERMWLRAVTPRI